MIKRLKLNHEIKRFNKLSSKDSIVPVSNGENLLYLYDKQTKKSYYPSFQLKIARY